MLIRKFKKTPYPNHRGLTPYDNSLGLRSGGNTLRPREARGGRAKRGEVGLCHQKPLALHIVKLIN